jgi:GT2 family glycosyltransferase
MEPDVSILIVSWNTCAATLSCLESLPTSVDSDVSYEAIVVDNASVDGSAAALAERDDIELIANPDNLGYAVGVNQAYRRATGRYILLLNSDIVFEQGALSRLVEFLDEQHDVAGVGPLYLNPDGTRQDHHYRFPTFAATLAGESAVFRALPWFNRALRRHWMLDDDFGAARPVPQPSASCLLLRRELLPPNEMMDEQFPIYFNDIELARSLATSGHVLWMTPASVVYHEHGASTRLLGGLKARQHIGAHVRYLRQTEPGYRVAVFQLVVFLQKLTLWAFRREGALSLADLLGAVRGDPGPLPQAAARSRTMTLVGTAAE